MVRERAYQSKLTITETTDSAADAEPMWPDGRPWQPTSAVTDSVDPALAELRRRVVDPVVTSVLTVDECDSVVVFEEPDHEVRATVVARGEASYHYLQMTRALPATDDELAGMAAQFASELEDFVAESGFAWGEQRIARYEIPPA